ncbi:hypothetical protein BJ912DRAFT_1037770 [Pholiota molesta]|nr:hypothetical protein BJ912DRAFT_1037770 [Pholiota molesta]
MGSTGQVRGSSKFLPNRHNIRKRGQQKNTEKSPPPLLMQRPPKKRSPTEKQAEGGGRRNSRSHHQLSVNNHIAGPTSDIDSTQGRNHLKPNGSERALGADQINSAQDGNVGAQRDREYTWIGPEKENATLADAYVPPSNPHERKTSRERPRFEGVQVEGGAHQATAHKRHDTAYQPTSNDARSFNPSQGSTPYLPNSYYEDSGRHGFYTYGSSANGVVSSPSTSADPSYAHWSSANTSHITSHGTDDHTAFALANAGHFPPHSQIPALGASGAFYQQNGAFDMAGRSQNLQSTAAEAYARHAAVPMPQVIAPANGAASGHTYGTAAMSLPSWAILGRVSDYSSLANALSSTSLSNATPISGYSSLANALSAAAAPSSSSSSSSNLPSSSLSWASNATSTQPILSNNVSSAPSLGVSGLSRVQQTPTTSLSSAGGHFQDSAVDEVVYQHAIDPSTIVATAPLGTSARALYVEVLTPQAPVSNTFSLWPLMAAAVPVPSGHDDLCLPYRQDTLQSVRNNYLASAAPHTVSPEGHHQGSGIDDAMAAVAIAPGGTSTRESLWRQLAAEGPSIVNNTLHSAAPPHAMCPLMGADACDRLSRLMHEISLEEWRQLVAELDLQSNVNDTKRVLQKIEEKAWHHLGAIEPGMDHSAARTRSGRRMVDGKDNRWEQDSPQFRRSPPGPEIGRLASNPNTLLLLNTKKMNKRKEDEIDTGMEARESGAAAAWPCRNRKHLKPNFFQVIPLLPFGWNTVNGLNLVSGAKVFSAK